MMSRDTIEVIPQLPDKKTQNMDANANKTPIELQIKKLSKTNKVILGTVSGMIATVLVHPFDVVKVRMQIREKKLSTLEIMKRIHRCEGFRGLYAGLSAGLMRQATYTTTRLATYHMLNEYYKKKQKKPKDVSLGTSDKVLIGVCAGLAGAFAGNPSEVALVRMMADGPRLCTPTERPRRYQGVFHAFYRIAHDDGLFALWRGGSLTLGRSVVVSIAQIGTYAEVNELLRQRDLLHGFPAHVATSLASSFVTTMLSLPIDLIKTRYQVRSDTVTQKDVFNDILKRKGIKYLWKGVFPYFIRMVIHTIATLVIFEEVVAAFYMAEKEQKK